MRYIALIPLLVGTLVTLGCDKKVEPNRAGGLGQTCLSTNDCGGNLVCLDAVCLYENLPLDPSANVCLECMTAEDCTDDGPQACDEEGFCRLNCTSDQDCVDFSEFGSVCESSTGDCYGFYECGSAIPCPTGFCDLTVGDDPNQGVCFDCLTNDNCGEEEVCSDRTCIPICTSDQDCDGFFVCNASTQLCEFFGCTTDRECASVSSNYFVQTAVCNEETNECEIPCERDADCLIFEESSNPYCQEGSCVALGCTTNDECRVAAGPNSVCVPPPSSSPSTP